MGYFCPALFTSSSFEFKCKKFESIISLSDRTSAFYYTFPKFKSSEYDSSLPSSDLKSA